MDNGDDLLVIGIVVFFFWLGEGKECCLGREVSGEVVKGVFYRIFVRRFFRSCIYSLECSGSFVFIWK